MERSRTTTTDNPGYGGAPDLVKAKVEDAARTAHRAADTVADRAAAQVDHLSGSAHQAIDSAADTAASVADWASAIPAQARQAQARLTESACASIRARPLATMTGALVVGYLLGRLARL